MAEFTYTNVKSASTSHLYFEFNYGYYYRVSYKKDVDPRSRWKAVDKIGPELRKLMSVYNENLQDAQKLQKRVHDNNVKLKSYVLEDKIW